MVLVVDCVLVDLLGVWLGLVLLRIDMLLLLPLRSKRAFIFVFVLQIFFLSFLA